MISRTTILKLVHSSPYVRIIPFEDVYFTGIVAGMFLHLRITNMEGIHTGYESGLLAWNQKDYPVSSRLIASHPHSKHEIIKWWRDEMRFHEKESQHLA